jgi:hypothetical protein
MVAKTSHNFGCTILCQWNGWRIWWNLIILTLVSIKLIIIGCCSVHWITYSYSVSEVVDGTLNVKGGWKEGAPVFVLIRLKMQLVDGNVYVYIVIESDDFYQKF